MTEEVIVDIVDKSDPMSNFFSPGSADNFTQNLKFLYNNEFIRMKSEMINPSGISALYSLGKKCCDCGMVKTAKRIKDHLDILLESLVSYKRKGREEYVDIFKAKLGGPESLSLADRLTKDLKKDV